MSEKKHEIYLIALALVIAAGLILYNVFQTPEFNAVVVPDKNVIETQTDDQLEETVFLQSETKPAEDNTTKAQIEATVTAVANNGTDAPKPVGPININTATKEELMTLTGIGEVKAAAILEYRKENGNFRSVDELNNVKGIGDKTLEKIRHDIIV